MKPHPKWILYDAQQLMLRVVEVAKLSGWGAALGGSLAFQHESENDLDIVFFPLKTSIFAAQAKLMEDLEERFDLRVKGAVRHLQDEKLVYTCKLKDGRKVDLLFPTLHFAERLVERYKVLIPKDLVSQ